MKKRFIITAILICVVVIGGAFLYTSFNTHTAVKNAAVDAVNTEHGILTGTVHDLEIDSEKFGDKRCYEVSFECMDSSNTQIEVEVIIDKKSREILSISTENDNA